MDEEGMIWIVGLMAVAGIVLAVLGTNSVAPGIDSAAIGIEPMEARLGGIGLLVLAIGGAWIAG